jgi:hypothetical protein
MRWWIILLATFFLMWPTFCLAAEEETPATKPAEPATLLGGNIRYTPPADWKFVKETSNDVNAAYLAPDHDGFLALQVAPPNAACNEAAGRMIIRGLRERHTKAGEVMVLTPRMEPDDRFDLRIHERYKNSHGKVADELHLYRKVGQRVCMLVVQSLSSDQKHLSEVHKAGEEMIDSARWAAKASDSRDKTHKELP